MTRRAGSSMQHSAVAKGRIMKFGRGGAFTALAWMVAVGCGTSSNDAAPKDGPDAAAPPAEVDAGTSDADAAPSPPAPPPPVDGVPVDGIFVSAASGNDAADATKLRPVKTLARAIAMAQEKPGMAVFACANDTFTEQLTLTEGLAIYGYFDCSTPDWKKDPAKAAVIQSPTSPAILAESLSEARLEGLTVSAAQGTGSPGASSFGMVVRNSTKVTLAEMAIAAADGQDGQDGVESATANGFVDPSTSAGKPSEAKVQRSCSNGLFCNFDIKDFAGNVLLAAGGSSGGSGTCLGGGAAKSGGWGGAGRLEHSGDYVVDVNDLNRRADCSGHTPTGAGIPGERGLFGANGTWSFSETGFAPGNGTPGQTGKPGGGGSGGDGKCDFNTMPPADGTYWRSGVGGGGGAGGCGGYAGTPGTGGGASVGLFVVNSGVTLTHVNVHAGNGGRGGAGFVGSTGAAGGIAGSPLFTSAEQGKTGQPGARGGQGGQSGHGAPGPSIALVYRGDRPTTQGGGVLSFEAAGDAAAPVTDGAQTLPSPERIAKNEHSF